MTRKEIDGLKMGDMLQLHDTAKTLGIVITVNAANFHHPMSVEILWLTNMYVGKYGSESLLVLRKCAELVCKAQ